jgi:hypothetical protein
MDAGSSYSHPPMPSPTSHLRFDTAAPDPDPALRLPNPHASYETDEEGVEEIRNGLHRNASAPLARPSRSRKPLRSQTLPVPAHTQDPVPDEASYWDADGPPMPVAESYMPVSPPSKRVAAPAMSMPMPEPSQYPKTSFIPRMPIPTPVASTPATPSDDLYSFMPSSDTDEDHAEMPMMPVPATRITLSMPEPDLPSELPVLADDDAEHERLLAQIVALEATLTELQVSASAADADASERTRLAAKVAALEAKLAAAEARAAATDSTPRAERADTIPGAPPPATAAQPPSHPTASEDAARAAAELAALRAQLSAATSTSARADAERKQLAQRVSALQADLTSSRTGAKTDADRLAKQLAAAQAQLRGAEASAAKQAAELQAARQAAASAASKARADAAAQKAKPAPPPERPPINGGAHLGTEYTHMLLALDAVPFWHNAAASAATWILLAGFVVLPGTFSTLSTLDAPDGTVEATVVHAVRHVSLYVFLPGSHHSGADRCSAS